MADMFPTRSRLQVAIALEKLCYAERDAINGLVTDYSSPKPGAGKYYSALYLAINERIRALTRALLHPPARSVYAPAQSPKLLSYVRGKAKEYRL